MNLGRVFSKTGRGAPALAPPPAPPRKAQYAAGDTTSALETSLLDTSVSSANRDSPRQHNMGYAHPQANPHATPRAGYAATPRAGPSATSAGMRTPRSRRIQTPRSVRSARSGRGIFAQTDASVILSLVEGRGKSKGEIGLAVLDLNQPLLTLSSFSDSSLYSRLLNKVQVLNPATIIFPDHASTNFQANVIASAEIIAESLPNINMIKVKRKYFADSKGIEVLMDLCVEDYASVVRQHRSKFYVMAAAAALIKYAEFHLNVVFAAKSLKMVYAGAGEKNMIIGSQTAIHLELLNNAEHMGQRGTLFDTLNRTKNTCGFRLLRTELLQPSSCRATIDARLDAVEELIQNEGVYSNLGTVLSRFQDLGSLLAKCVQLPKTEDPKASEIRVQTALQLKATLELVDPLRKAIEGTQSQLMQKFQQVLHDQRYADMLTGLSKVVSGDATKTTGVLNTQKQKLFAVREGVSCLLDVARRTYSETVDDIMGEST